MTSSHDLATLGSALNPDVLSPESSTSTWQTPLSPVYMSPVRQAPPSPVADTLPPLYALPSPTTSTPQTPQDPTLPSPPPSPATSPPRDPQLSPATPSPTEVAMSSYVSPFQKVISAAARGDQQQLSTHSSDLSARVIRLTGMADSAASALDRNADLVR